MSHIRSALLSDVLHAGLFATLNQIVLEKGKAKVLAAEEAKVAGDAHKVIKKRKSTAAYLRRDTSFHVRACKHNTTHQPPFFT